MQIHRASRSHSRRALRQSPAPLPPLLAVKLIEIFESMLLAFGFARMDIIKQCNYDRIA
jgi:hypothetical protein